jgi:hypothetical protein
MPDTALADALRRAGFDPGGQSQPGAQRPRRQGR